MIKKIQPEDVRKRKQNEITMFLSAPVEIRTAGTCSSWNSKYTIWQLDRLSIEELSLEIVFRRSIEELIFIISICSRKVFWFEYIQAWSGKPSIFKELWVKIYRLSAFIDLDISFNTYLIMDFLSWMVLLSINKNFDLLKLIFFIRNSCMLISDSLASISALGLVDEYSRSLNTTFSKRNVDRKSLKICEFTMTPLLIPSEMYFYLITNRLFLFSIFLINLLKKIRKFLCKSYHIETKVYSARLAKQSSNSLSVICHEKFENFRPSKR